MPELKIVRFSDNSSNLLAFFTFKSSFINAMESISGVALTTKLVYLKSYLSGRALTLIENLPITDENYVAAWNILEEELLDEGFLIDQGLTEIVAWPSCRSLEDTMRFTTHLKCKLTELQKFNVNLLLENSAGNILLSNTVRNKL